MDTIKKIGSGTLIVTEATLYTVPSLTKTIIKEVILYNPDSSVVKNATIKFDDLVIHNKDLAAKETLILKFTAVLEATKTIKGTGEVNYYISGIEIS